MKDEKMGSIDDCVQGFNHEKLVSEAHDLTPIFSITAPTETGTELNVDCHSFKNGEFTYYKISIVTEGNKARKKEYVSAEFDYSLREAMEAIASFCEQSPEKVIAHSVVVVPPVTEGSSTRYELMSEDIKGRFIAWFDSEEVAKKAYEAYNFICDYIPLLKKVELDIPQINTKFYSPWVYRNDDDVSIYFLNEDGSIESHISVEHNSLFRNSDVICHRKGNGYANDGSVSIMGHGKSFMAMRHVFLLVKRDLDIRYHFLEPPVLYVERQIKSNRFEVKFKDYNIPLRMSFDRMDDAIEFAGELRNLFEYNAKEKASRYTEYRAYGETLSSMDFLSVCFE